MSLPFSGVSLYSAKEKNAAASGKKGGKPKKPGNLAKDALSAKAHQSVRNADQDNNSGVEAAHFTEGSAEGAARAGSRFQYGRKLRQYKKLERLEKKADKDAVDSIFAERMKSDPQAGSNFFSRWRQKQAIKKEYAAAKAGAAAVENTAAGTAKAAQGTASMTEKAFQFVQSHSHIIIGIAAVGLLVLVIAGSVSSCSVLINGGGNVVLGTSYTAEDEDLKGVETDYTKLEDKLRKQIDRIETDHPGYDEYRYNLAEIGHNPYELASLLTVEFENYTRSQVQARLQSIFDAQYELKLEEKVERKGLNVTLFQWARKFYNLYPQMADNLVPMNFIKDKGICATASHKSEGIKFIARKSATASHNFMTPGAILISRLSYSHIREIMAIDDPLACYFYE